jgi:hypothetical protein
VRHQFETRSFRQHHHQRIRHCHRFFAAFRLIDDGAIRLTHPGGFRGGSPALQAGHGILGSEQGPCGPTTLRW